MRTRRFESEVAVLREDVRLVDEGERRLAALDAAMKEGVASVRAGRTKPADEVFDRLEAKSRAMAAGKRRFHTRARLKTAGASKAGVALRPPIRFHARGGG